MLVSLMSGNTQEMFLNNREEDSCKWETEISTVMSSLTETHLTINNLRIKMIQMILSLITTVSSTHSKEPEILPKWADHPDNIHNSDFPKWEIETSIAMNSPTETHLTINNSKTKMIQMIQSLITTDSSTHSKEPEILPKWADHPDNNHNSALLKFKTCKKSNSFKDNINCN